MTATTTTERPILFTPRMAQAVFEGRKTQTRRLVKPQPKIATAQLGDNRGAESWVWECRTSAFSQQHLQWVGDAHPEMIGLCPYGSPGDRLWVRESCVVGFPAPGGDVQSCDEDGKDLPKHVWYPEVYEPGKGWRSQLGHYIEVWTDEDGGQVDRIPWKPSIHMPRWACRSVLEITRVRVERVQDISEEDALAEGFEGRTVAATLNGKPGNYIVGSAREAFFETFYDINKRAPRDANPWVWVIEFTRLAAQNKEHA